MPLKIKPYKHQQEAFEFACRLFGLVESGDDNNNNLHNMRKNDLSKTLSNQEKNESFLLQELS